MPDPAEKFNPLSPRKSIFENKVSALRIWFQGTGTVTGWFPGRISSEQ